MSDGIRKVSSDVKKLMSKNVFVALAAVLVFAGTLISGHSRQYPAIRKESFPESFAALDPIDTHVHVYKEDPALDALLTEFNLRFVDILLIDDKDKFFKDLGPQYSDAISLTHSHPGRIDLCTTFSPYDFEQQGFSRRAISQLDADFRNGAVAVKIYKTIGMEIKKNSGKYLMPDDPVFDPIYAEIASRNQTVVAHIAEPTSCWNPPNRESPDYAYYNSHPEEYAYLHPEWPSKAKILKARDRMLQKHSTLRVVGAHLGSMEVDVKDIAKRFDRYPNFSVDTAARVEYFTRQSRGKVRDFLIKYQDRVLYATDFNLMPEQNTDEALKGLRATYERDWTYFATDDVVTYGVHKIQGLGLPPSVLLKLYHSNALRWIPGLSTAKN